MIVPGRATRFTVVVRPFSISISWQYFAFAREETSDVSEGCRWKFVLAIV